VGAGLIIVFWSLCGCPSAMAASAGGAPGYLAVYCGGVVGLLAGVVPADLPVARTSGVASAGRLVDCPI
jgi:hypothetical protein